MNKHIFLDNLAASAGAMIAGKRKFFAKSIQSPTWEEQVAGAELTFPTINGGGIFDIKAKTRVGKLDPAFRVAQWKGSEYPTIIYHHGNNERPFDFKKGAKNTFYNIFINTTEEVEANLIAVRAPFHNCPLKHYQEKMVELSNFTAMIATSVRLNECIIHQIRKASSQPVITAGISLGGWVTNLHRSIYNTSDRYIPIMAGTLPGELFIRSKYRKLTSPLALQNPELLRDKLNYSELFEKVKSENVFPLLAKHDQFVEFDVQKGIYNGYPLAVMDKGHITGALSTKTIRNHILTSLINLTTEFV